MFATGEMAERPELREAFAYSLDRTALAPLYRGPLEPGGRFLHARCLGADPALEGFGHDPARAQRLLAAAGHPGGEGLRPIRLGFRDTEIERLRIAKPPDVPIGHVPPEAPVMTYVLRPAVRDAVDPVSGRVEARYEVDVLSSLWLAE